MTREGECLPSLEQLLESEGVAEELRPGVLRFLRAQGLGEPRHLALAEPEDLSDAFTASETLGHRAAVRRLRVAAQRHLPGVRPAADGWLSWLDGLKPLKTLDFWLAPSALRAWRAWAELRLRAPGLFVPLWAIGLAGVLGLFHEYNDTWSFLTEWDQRCDHPPLENDTGIQFLVTSSSQRGAREVSHALHDLGARPSYQGVDLEALFWSGFYDDHHRRLTGGYERGYVQHWIYPLLRRHYGWDSELLMQTKREELARQLSRCRIRALSFTGVESLFWPVYHASPNATVIVVQMLGTDWLQPYGNDHLNRNFVWSYPFILLWASALHTFPWGALLHLLDPLLGGPLRARLATGAPPLTQGWDALTALWFRTLTHRRSEAHRVAGLAWSPMTMGEYVAVSEALQASVPTERLKVWNQDEHTWQDLCRLAGVDPCPWKGRLRERKPLPDFYFDDIGTFWRQSVVHLLLIWLNAQILALLLRPVARLLGERNTRRLWLLTKLATVPAVAIFVLDALAKIAAIVELPAF